MKTLYHLLVSFLVIVLASCTNTAQPTEAPQLTGTIQATPVVISTDLAFSTPLVQVLSQSGLTIMSVQSSTYMAMFASTNKAVWVKTNEGVVEVIIFNDPSEVEQIHITEQSNQAEGRHLYTIQASAPILLQDQTIDAAFSLYFTVSHGMLMITSSEELDKSLKHIFSGQ